MADKPTYEELEQRIKELEVESARLKQAEEAILGSEKSLRCLFDSSAFGMIVCRLIRDKAGKSVDFEHLEVNQATQRQTGLKPEQLIGKRASEIVSAELTAHIVQIYSKVVETGKPHRYEEYFSVYDRTLQVGASHIEGDLFALTFVDISAWKQAEEALRESEERYRMIFNNAPLGIMHFDANGIIRDFNDNFTQIMAAPRENILGFNMLERLRDKEMHKAVKDSLNGQLGYYEGDYLSITGANTTSMRAIYQSIIGEDGKVFGAVGLFEDITERKQAEEALQESEKKYRELVENANSIILKYDLNGKIIVIN